MTSEATFIAAIVALLLASRLLGEAAQRFGQLAVIGQLAAGVLLGPSLFGLVWSQAQQAAFPTIRRRERCSTRSPNSGCCCWCC